MLLINWKVAEKGTPPPALSQHTLVAINQNIYVVGGSLLYKNIPLPNPQSAIFFHSFFSLPRTSNLIWLNNKWVFNTETNTWNVIETATPAKYRSRIVAVNNDILLLKGIISFLYFGVINLTLVNFMIFKMLNIILKQTSGPTLKCTSLFFLFFSFLFFFLLSFCFSIYPLFS